MKKYRGWYIICNACNGSGDGHDEGQICWKCRGLGTIPDEDSFNDYYGDYDDTNNNESEDKND